MPASRLEPVAVYLEAGRRRVFACAVDWPGWCRSGKDDEGALARLAEYVVTTEAGLDLPGSAGESFEVVERVPGSSTTDFGAPGSVAAGDAEPLTPVQGRRIAALVTASWSVLERVVADSPAELRKGPRGGGRDRDAIAAHVVSAEAAYARKIGDRRRKPDPGDVAAMTSCARRSSRWCAPAGRPRRWIAAGRCATPPAGSPGTHSTTPGRSRTAGRTDSAADPAAVRAAGSEQATAQPMRVADPSFGGSPDR